MAFLIGHGHHICEFKKSKRVILFDKLTTSGYVKEVDSISRKRKLNKNDDDLNDLKSKIAKYENMKNKFVSVRDNLNKYKIAYCNLTKKYTKTKEAYTTEKRNYWELLQLYNKNKVKLENKILENEKLVQENHKIKRMAIKSKGYLNDNNKPMKKKNQIDEDDADLFSGNLFYYFN